MEGIELPAPAYDEIEGIINNVKLNVAPGSGNITPELIQGAGEEL